MKPIKKAIIPAAGLGTRFLPATKATPKEMLPIIDKPMIQYIVEEAIASGIEDIIIVTGKNKRAIEDHFDHSFELESHLEEKQKLQELFDVRQPGNVDIHYIRQKEAKGLGHAVWCARKFIGDEPFAVLLGDDIIDAGNPGLKQLITQYDMVGSSVVAVQEVSAEETNRYGIIEYDHHQDKLYKVNAMIEKPAPGTTSSRMAIMGRYILTPEIFTILDQQKVGAGGEVQLTDAIEQLLETQDVYGYAFEGKRYDVGEKLGFVKTTIDLALRRADLKDDVLAYLQEVLKEMKTHS
ncbi:UTP--glucose-1-phosphate uridylyltransferase GalU [Chryseomicrobium sp. FSL W7-1435]|uniref:UTP--glucose-1-phosphate uridylyltransferase GalU n=1 Tax=Chryseomicrobium sp. FSL W7-1435 TaxID=2921704 RepID=UPI00315B3F36